MTISTTALLTRLARKVGDKDAITSTGAIWDLTDLTQTLQESVEESWSYFYVPVQDLTTYTGSVNSIAVNTAEIAVPAAFLPGASTSAVAPPGFISALQVRETGSLTYTEPLAVDWQFISMGLRIDPLTLASPKIRFMNPFNQIFEMRILGGVGLTLPALATDPISGTNEPGLVNYLLELASSKLFQMRETSSNEDERGFRTRRLLAEQRAKELKAQYRMIWPSFTVFSWV